MGLGGGETALPALNIAKPPPIDLSKAPEGYKAWDKNLSYGGADDFGAADYSQALKSVSGDRGHLQYRRKEIMDWLGTEAGQNALWEGNRKGKGTFYDKLASGDQLWNLGLNPSARVEGGDEKQREQYGYADLYHGMALGKSDREIADFAETNKDRFSSFGLYQQIQNAADRSDKQEDLVKQYQTTVGDQATEASKKITDFGSSLEEKLSDIQGTFKQDKEATKKSLEDFAKHQAAYEKQQSAWQERQAAATNQMQIAQMKAMNQKPVMQIMPTGSGGGMSARSLAAKKKLNTGLSIT